MSTFLCVWEKAWIPLTSVSTLTSLIRWQGQELGQVKDFSPPATIPVLLVTIYKQKELAVITKLSILPLGEPPRRRNVLVLPHNSTLTTLELSDRKIKNWSGINVDEKKGDETRAENIQRKERRQGKKQKKKKEKWKEERYQESWWRKRKKIETEWVKRSLNRRRSMKR